MPTDLPPLPEPAPETYPFYSLAQMDAFGHACRVVDDQMISAFLDAQPFATSRNDSTRAWELFRCTEPTYLREVVRAALTAALGGSP